MTGQGALDASAFVIGCGLAIVTDAVVRRRTADRVTSVAGVGLVGAALVYPMARRRGTDDPDRRRIERIAVVAATAVVAAAMSASAASSRQLVAAGWAAHAVFDLLHDAGPDSRLPRWYPALCAGYDVAVAATLLVPRRATQRRRAR